MSFVGFHCSKYVIHWVSEVSVIYPPELQKGLSTACDILLSYDRFERRRAQKWAIFAVVNCLLHGTYLPCVGTAAIKYMPGLPLRRTPFRHTPNPTNHNGLNVKGKYRAEIDSAVVIETNPTSNVVPANTLKVPKDFSTHSIAAYNAQIAPPPQVMPQTPTERQTPIVPPTSNTGAARSALTAWTTPAGKCCPRNPCNRWL